MTKFEQILRNPPKKWKNKKYTGSLGERIIDYPTWISQLREAIREIIPPTGIEPEICCVGGHTNENCEKNIKSIAYCKGHDDAVNKFNQSLDKVMGVGK